MDTFSIRQSPSLGGMGGRRAVRHGDRGRLQFAPLLLRADGRGVDSADVVQAESVLGDIKLIEQMAGQLLGFVG
jgi:hypothetical protein